MRRLLLGLALSALLVALPACKQGEGDRCEIDSDCESNKCVVSGTAQEGICRSGATPDAGRDTPLDVTSTELPSDLRPDSSSETAAD